MKFDSAGVQIPETPDEINHLRQLVGNHTGMDADRRHGHEPSCLYYLNNGVFMCEVSPGVEKHFAVIEADEVIEVRDPDLRRGHDEKGNFL